MASIQERVRAVEEQQTMHEEVCAARWGILLKVVGWGGVTAVSLVLAVGGFGLREIYNAQQRNTEILRSLSTRIDGKSEVMVVTPPATLPAAP